MRLYPYARATMLERADLRVICLTLMSAPLAAAASPPEDPGLVFNPSRATRIETPSLGLLGPAEPPTPDAQPAQSDTRERQRSWELPAVVVEDTPTPALREEERIGSYGQPRWTASRRFPSTRIYVVPEGKVEVEAWARATVNRDRQGGGTDWRFLQEIEIGLPYRFQLDLYFRQDYSTETDKTKFGGQFELRWALADWEEIWGNPTLYFEYITLENRPDKIEPKLLLGGEIAEGWHWGANFVAELELGGEREYEYAFTGALARSILDEKLSLGVETVVSLTDVRGDRGNFNTSVVVGPSIQWKPAHGFTINIAPLVGVTRQSPIIQVYFNVGWEF